MLMVGSSLGHVLSHHRVFWDGFKLGVSMRIQTSAAVHRKALKLRASTVESLQYWLGSSVCGPFYSSLARAPAGFAREVHRKSAAPNCTVHR
eukprot:scaffold207_cov409-Prasinococcus_capsulatus_cf.AAC.77